MISNCSNAISTVASPLRPKICEKWVRINRTNEVSTLGRNSLSGTLPTSLGRHTNITFLGLYRTNDVDGNRGISGVVPTQLGNLAALSELCEQYKRSSLTRTRVEQTVPNIR